MWSQLSSQADTSRERTVQALARGQEALWTVLEEQTVCTAYLAASLRCAGVGRRQPARAPGVTISRGLGQAGDTAVPILLPGRGPLLADARAFVKGRRGRLACVPESSPGQAQSSATMERARSSLSLASFSRSRCSSGQPGWSSCWVKSPKILCISE